MSPMWGESWRAPPPMANRCTPSHLLTVQNRLNLHKYCQRVPPSCSGGAVPENNTIVAKIGPHDLLWISENCFFHQSQPPRRISTRVSRGGLGHSFVPLHAGIGKTASGDYVRHSVVLGWRLVCQLPEREAPRPRERRTENTENHIKARVWKRDMMEFPSQTTTKSSTSCQYAHRVCRRTSCGSCYRAEWHRQSPGR